MTPEELGTLETAAKRAASQICDAAAVLRWRRGTPGGMKARDARG